MHNAQFNILMHCKRRKR